MLFVAGAVGVSTVVALLRTTYFLDDAAFYFRYVESLAGGLGYRFNAAETPVWGASAPLWPALLALPVAFGASVTSSAAYAGLALTLFAVLIATRVADRIAGALAAGAVIALACLDFRVMLLATQGLESPLSYLVLAAAVWVVSAARRWFVTGLIAGLCIVHKLDFVHVGLLVLAGVAVRDRRFPAREVVTASVIALAWYGFAAFHFGSPLPNSFLTKVATSAASPLPWSWFLRTTFFDGLGPGLAFFAVVGTVLCWKSFRPVVLTLAGFAAVQAVAYTIKVPSEPYIWYTAPVRFALVILAGVGVGRAHELVVARLGRRVIAVVPLLAAACIAIGLRGAWEETSFLRRFVDSFEAARTASGRWVKAHAPPGSTLATGYGNPAYFAGADVTVYDWSHLNRRPLPGSRLALPSEVIAEHRPDFVIDCPLGSGVHPSEARPPQGYVAAAAFDEPLQAGTGDFFCVVSVRRDGRAAGVASPMAPRDLYALGTPIVFGRGGNATLFAREGFSSPESGFTWTDGPRATLRLLLHEPPIAGAILKVAATPFRTPALKAQRVKVEVNGRAVGELTFDSDAVVEAALEVGGPLIAGVRRLIVVLHLLDARPTTQVGGADARALGLAVRRIVLEPFGTMRVGP